MAMQANFGNGVLYPPRTGHHTLQVIYEISKEVDPWDLNKFQKAAKAAHLSGVHMPYWSDWMFACPSIFLTGEILHTCIKFFADHPLNWVKETVGKRELDARFMVQHKQGGSTETFNAPLLLQLQASLHPDLFIQSNPVHFPDSLHSMVQALSDFHAFKDAIIHAEARRGKKGVKEDFFIPKLELLQSFRGTVERLGTLMQFSADMTERLLITHCKHLFECTNRRSTDFMEQCVRILNCQESMELFNLYTLFYSRGASLINAIHIEDEEVTTINPALSWFRIIFLRAFFLKMLSPPSI
ncbi:hypothetical protein BDR03DRAFT_1018285 [Suillus americanus]|nr:hypothetical protein BDR03DRAFT_1018285 [Suillus americanus]